MHYHRVTIVFQKQLLHSIQNNTHFSHIAVFGLVFGLGFGPIHLMTKSL